jgi:NADH:ubiquinone reductase (H+-translocating)
MTAPALARPRLPRQVARQVARNGTLIIGGGFGGAHVARLLGRAGATIVSPDTSMLYTPLLPEVAGGAVEARHVMVPLRQMCPDAQLLRGRAVRLDEQAKVVEVATDAGPVEVAYERLVVALGSTARMLPIPGLAERAIAFKALGDAIHLRDHVLRRLDLAERDPADRVRHLTFVFVGAGYAGVEALAETMQMVHDVLPSYRGLQDASIRWVLVNAGERILAEVPGGLGAYADRLLTRRGVEVHNATTLTRADEGSVTLSDGTVVPTETLVWTAGVVPHPLVAELGLPLDERGRIVVDGSLQVAGRDDVWALGDCARVPNAATPERPDPPTCQHALRQARALVRSLAGEPVTYRYRSVGEGATLGRDRGIARIGPLHLRRAPASLVVRAYHLKAVPVRSRRLRILADGLIAMFFRRDMADLGTVTAEWARP